MTKPLEALIADMKAAAENFSRLRELMWNQSPGSDFQEYSEALAKYAVNTACVENVLTLIAALEQKDRDIEELVNERVELSTALSSTTIRAENAEKRIAELEASQLAVKLPQNATPLDAAAAIRACMDEFPEAVQDIVEECAVIAENTIRAAGGTVGGE